MNPKKQPFTKNLNAKQKEHLRNLTLPKFQLKFYPIEKGFNLFSYNRQKNDVIKYTFNCIIILNVCFIINEKNGK